MKDRMLLRDEITDEIKTLKKLEVGTEQYKIAVDGVTKLINVDTELDKTESEIKLRREAQEIENELKIARLRSERRTEIAKNVISAVSIILTAGVTVWGTMTVLKYDENGIAPTTGIGRLFINRLIPKN